MLDLHHPVTSSPLAPLFDAEVDQHDEPGGLPIAFLTDLTLRHFARNGELRLAQVARRLGLGTQATDELLKRMRGLQLLEVPRRGTLDGDVSYALTDTGHRQARLAFEKCQYVGPAPVTLEEYVAQVRRQSRGTDPVEIHTLKTALQGMVLPDELLPALGGAMNSGKAMYLYGHSGSGKTFLAEHLVKTLQGDIWVPHAVYADGEIIQVFDPMVHRLAATLDDSDAGLERAPSADRRWARVQRPVVIAGGELTLDMLELGYDPHTRLHIAPPQMKANNGIFIVDDLGRQRVAPRDLMNRWIVPLDRQIDYLGLNNGIKFETPFDVKVIFSSNLTPEKLVDPAFARRLGYKIHVPPLDAARYREVVLQACANTGVPPDADSIDFLVNTLHPRHDQAYYPCIPRDVISKIADRARYLRQPPRMTPDLLGWAWVLYFGEGEEPAPPTASH